MADAKRQVKPENGRGQRQRRGIVTRSQLIRSARHIFARDDSNMPASKTLRCARGRRVERFTTTLKTKRTYSPSLKRMWLGIARARSAVACFADHQGTYGCPGPVSCPFEQRSGAHAVKRRVQTLRDTASSQAQAPGRPAAGHATAHVDPGNQSVASAIGWAIDQHKTH